ncbi:MAG: UDP-N-acetylmuramoyl-L-alanine--D-glutamate ligase, partial [Gammaproteobacteria bacterium]|nr:UDP-N-acetylmuramoyl-L-alanine--D-glutamate ligase [Gammaproteobacteria bacterium]
MIVGLGKSGLSAARFLHARGWRLAATDSRAAPPGRSEFVALAPQARVTIGRFDAALLEECRLVVVSPGVSLREPLV